MFRNLYRRIAAGVGRTMLIVAVLGLAGTATIALGASKKATTPKTAPRAVSTTKDESAWKTQAYSKTSEFAQRLTLLEFSEKNNPACEPTTKLLNEMRRKNYPIQRVERVSGGDVLFEQYQVKTVPTLVLLFDGKELGRLVVRKDDVGVTAKRLLALFQKGRDAVAANPRVRTKEPEYLSQAKPALGFLFPHSLDRAVKTLGQSLDMGAPETAQSVESEASILDARTEEISNLIGEARLEASTIRVVVKDPNGGVPREGVGSAIHYNSEYHEVLSVVASSLFTGIDDPATYPGVTVEVFNAETGALENSGAQCVRCDPNSGVAFVAAQVESPVKPVAFLPKKSPLEPGERGVSFSRRPDGVVKSYHDVSSVDQRRFYENSEEQSSYFSYVEATNPPAAQDVGSGFYVLRNGRFYFAGLFVSGANVAEACVVPAAVVSQSLLVNRNLTTVYRDQIAGKFDAPATDAEIDSAIARLMELDAQKKAAENVAPARQKTDALAASNAPGASVAFSKPVSSLDENGKPVVDLSGVNSAVASPEDVQRADVALSKPSEFSNFPDNATEAFARSAAATNALSDDSSFPTAQSSQALPNAPLAAPPEAEPAPDNSSFQVAQAFQNRPVASESHDALESVREATLNESATLADAAPQTTASETDSASSTRSQLALNDSPLSHSVADPLADSMSANSLPTPDADAALVAGGAYPDPLADPLPAPQNSLLDEDAPANDPLLASASKNPPAPQVQTSNEQVAQPQTPAPQIVAQTAPNAQGSSYAADPLPTPNSELIRWTTFNNREKVEAFNKEEEQFEAALDALRRRGMEGAEIICIVNWSDDANGARETEVVRIPRRTVLTNPAAPGAGVELVSNPNGSRAAAQASAPNAVPAPAAQNSVPMTSNLPDSRLYK